MGRGGQVRQITLEFSFLEQMALWGASFLNSCYLQGLVSWVTLRVKQNPLLNQALDLKGSRQVFLKTSVCLSLLLSYPFPNSSHHLPSETHLKHHLFFFSLLPSAIGLFLLKQLITSMKMLCFVDQTFFQPGKSQNTIKLMNFLQFAWISQILNSINLNTIHITCAVVSPSFFQNRWSQVTRAIRRL